MSDNWGVWREIVSIYRENPYFRLLVWMPVIATVVYIVATLLAS